MPGYLCNKNCLDLIYFRKINEINVKFTKYLNESCELYFDEHFSIKYFLKTSFVREISPKWSVAFGRYQHEWVEMKSQCSWIDDNVTVFLLLFSVEGGSEEWWSAIPVADHAESGPVKRGDPAVRWPRPLAAVLPPTLRRRLQENGTQGREANLCFCIINKWLL